MSSSTLTPETRPAALTRCREAFALDGEQAVEQVLQQEFKLNEESAQACAGESRTALAAEFRAERADPRPGATEFYRKMKAEKEASWAARITAQTRIDELWDVAERAQQRDADEDAWVLEAYAFYHLVLRSKDVKPPARLRARKQLDLLLRGAKRRRSERNDDRYGLDVDLTEMDERAMAWMSRTAQPARAASPRKTAASQGISATNPAPVTLPHAAPATQPSEDFEDFKHALADELADDALAADSLPNEPRADDALAEASTANDPRAEVPSRAAHVVNILPGVSPEEFRGLPAHVCDGSTPFVLTGLPPDGADPYDSVFTPEERAAMDAALRAAPRDADPFEVALNAYLDVKFPGTTPIPIEDVDLSTLFEKPEVPKHGSSPALSPTDIAGQASCPDLTPSASPSSPRAPPSSDAGA